MNGFSWTTLSPLMPELFLAVSAMAILMAGAFRGEAFFWRAKQLAEMALLVVVFLLLRQNWTSMSALNGMFVADSFSQVLKILISFGLLASLALSGHYLLRENMGRFEYPVLVLLAGLGMMLMVSAANLLSVYVALELQSLSLYVLAAFRRDHGESSEAGLKYFILGALASGMMLFGISLIYGYTGVIDFQAIEWALRERGGGTGLTIGLVFLLVGIGFKISAVPFHMWTPDVYEGAPTCVTALFAIVPKVAALGLIVRLLSGPFSVETAQWGQIIWILSAGSMVVGAFAGIGQSSIKRLLAYSSIGNMGYALIGIAAGNAEGAGAVLTYMAIYMAMTAGVFAVILSVGRERIADFAGLSRTAPFMAWALAILMFSMAGIPPMAGFFGKLVIFKAAMGAGLNVLAVLGVLSSVVAAYYYLKIIKVMFFDEPVQLESLPFSTGLKTGTAGVMLSSLLFVTLFILFPNALIVIGINVAAPLFPG